MLQNLDGLVQERRNSSALAMELRLSCTNPSIISLQLYISWETCQLQTIFSLAYKLIAAEERQTNGDR